MCPGGWIVPASTENDEVVVNGMSLSRRDSPFANSGMVSTVEPEDLRPLVKEHGVLAGLAFQKELERAAKQAGGGGQVAPGQRVTDFLAGQNLRRSAGNQLLPRHETRARCTNCCHHGSPAACAKDCGSSTARCAAMSPASRSC